MRTIVFILAAVVFCSAVFAAEKDAGLVLHYTFDKGAGRTVRDKSGHGNDGTIRGKTDWVKEKSYTALRFNGTDTYVECPPNPSLELSKAGTREVWCQPEAIQGGLISWYPELMPEGSSYAWREREFLENRLGLTFMSTRYYGTALTGFVSDGTHGCGRIGEPWRFNIYVEIGQWSHFALTFDGARMRLYQNGRLRSWRPQNGCPEVKGVPLRVGVVGHLSKGHFRGCLSEVRVYDRVLSPREIAAQYVRGAGARGLKTGLRMSPLLYAKRGKLIVEVDVIHVQPLSSTAQLKVELKDVAKNIVQQVSREVPQGADTVEVEFDTRELRAGAYEIQATVVDRDGAVGETVTEKWQFPTAAQLLDTEPGTKILNNLVTELVNLDSIPAQPSYREIPFTNPRRGWVFVSLTAALRIYATTPAMHSHTQRLVADTLWVLPTLYLWAQQERIFFR